MCVEQVFRHLCETQYMRVELPLGCHTRCPFRYLAVPVVYMAKILPREWIWAKHVGEQKICHLISWEKRCPFITGDWNAKVGSQEMPGVIGKFGLGVQNEAGQRLTEFCQENALVVANTVFQQHKRRLYTWTSPDGQHRNQIDYILCSQRWGSSIQSTKT